MKKIDREEAFRRLSEATPTPKTELIYKNAYTLSVAVTLSAQATDVGVNKATERLFEIVQTPEQMIELGLEKLFSFIKTINFYPSKGKHIIAAAQMLVNHFGSQIPDTRMDLEKLPGVGRKTANVILNVAFGQPTIAVDTHIFRVANRTGIACGKTPLDVENQLEKGVPHRYKQNIHHLLILHGRYICKARNPICSSCILKDLCDYYKILQSKID